jgi:TRAP-type C4-dicarboxylate transport system permease small subunit
MNKKMDFFIKKMDFFIKKIYFSSLIQVIIIFMIFIIIISFYSTNHVANKKNKIIKIKENHMNERI